MAVRHRREPGGWSPAMRAALAVERRIFRRPPAGLATPVAPVPETSPVRPAALRIDLCGNAAAAPVPTLEVRFDGAPHDANAVVALARQHLPDIQVRLDGRAVGLASPMVDRPESVALGADDVFARAVTLVEALVARFERNELAPGTSPVGSDAADGGGPGFASSYLGLALPRLGREALRRIRFRHAHWRVGYRFVDTPGVAETGVLGNGWSVLPDDGDAFLRRSLRLRMARPLPHLRRGLSAATRKAVISRRRASMTAGAPATPAR